MSVPPKKKKKMVKKKKAAAAAGGGDVDTAQAQAWLDSLKIGDVISPKFFSDEYLVQAASEFKEQKPFPHLRVANFMDDAFVRRLREEVEQVEYKQKHNDLYEFHQSNDLKSVNSPLITKLKQVLYSEEMRAALTKISGIPLFGLEGSVDMSAAVYQDTHRLLCHDDELSGRRIAYILYLVPEWSEKDGGTLDLFSVNENKEPTSVYASLVPAWNNFTFFEVSAVSYHQVSEVLTDKNRVSVSGWFHGPPIERVTRSLDAELPFIVPISGPQLDQWVSREYRRAGLIKKVNKKFAEDSSLELHNYLRKEKYEELVEALGKVRWTQVGPANRRHYGIEEKTEPGVVQSFREFIQSEEFRGHLKEITGLDLNNVHAEVRRMAPGDYSLAHSFDPENKKSGLDVLFNFIPPKSKWDASFGATLHYLANDKDEELLTVEPNANTLALVYRTAEGALRFLHYVNHRAPGPLYQAGVTFRTPDEDQSDDDDDEGDESETKEAPAADAAAANTPASS